MLSFPKTQYIGRSLQLRKPLTDVQNIRTHEKYQLIIDKYLFNPRKNSEQILSKRKFADTVKSSRDNNTAGVYESKEIFKLPKMIKTKRKFQINEGTLQECSLAVIPCIRYSNTPEISGGQRAKSVKLRKKTKINCKIQTEVSVIIEDGSQDEESPMKYKPKYNKI